tara:strand:- start:154 stop:378 length:225 start_codon:yes stop_codon:yes gene_type:complete
MRNNKFIIDLLGLKCPLPVLKANRIIKNYSKGDIIEFLVNDKAAPNDFKVFCETKNFELLSITKNDNIIIKVKV